MIDIIKGNVKFVASTLELFCKEAVNLPLRSVHWCVSLIYSEIGFT